MNIEAFETTAVFNWLDVVVMTIIVLSSVCAICVATYADIDHWFTKKKPVDEPREHLQ